MNTQMYLQRIGYKGDLLPSKEVLCALHRAHLYAIPFENLDIYHQKWIPYELDYFFEKVVEHRRGGFCYELNGLFAKLLREIGFHVSYISARLPEPHGEMSHEYDHLALLVEAEGRQYLCDVGFGNAIYEPMLIMPGIKSIQEGRSFGIEETGDFLCLTETAKDRKSHPVYYFTLQPREWSEFYDMFVSHQLSPDSKFRKKRICSLPTPNGRITLGNLRLIITQNIQRSIVQLKSEEEFFEQLLHHFNIRFSLQG